MNKRCRYEILQNSKSVTLTANFVLEVYPPYFCNYPVQYNPQFI